GRPQTATMKSLDYFYRSLLAALIANIQDGVMAEDESGRIIVANQAYSRMFGLPAPDELVGSCAHVIREKVWRDLSGEGDGYPRLTAELRQRREPQLDFQPVLSPPRLFHP